LGLFIFIITTFLLGLAGGLFYLVYIPFKKRLIKKGKLTKQRSKHINTIYIWTIVLVSAYFTIDAFFPGKSFYRDEFKTVTLRDLPKSAEFIEKNSSYPDFHGDYCSSSQIKLSKADYEKLLQDLAVDKRMTKDGKLVGSEEFSMTLNGKKPTSIIHSFTRQIVGQEDHHQYIGFYSDGQTIFVNVCVT
jgi:hypothetical protein